MLTNWSSISLKLRNSHLNSQKHLVNIIQHIPLNLDGIIFRNRSSSLSTPVNNFYSPIDYFRISLTPSSLEKYENLFFLSLNDCGITSLDGLPNLSKLIRVTNTNGLIA